MKNVPLIYVGRRIFNADKGQIAYAFLDGKEEIYFARNRYLTIGHVYEGVRKNKDTTITKWPRDLGAAKIDPVKIKEWEKHDTLAEVFAKRVREGKKAQRKAQTFAREHLAFRDAVRGMHYLEKRQFIEFLIDEIERLEDAKRK